MERGDIVVCVDDAGVTEWVRHHNYYTVREYLPVGSINVVTGTPWRYDDLSGGVYLEEVRAYVPDVIFEVPFRASRFQKVSTMDLIALMEEKEAEYVVV